MEVKGKIKLKGETETFGANGFRKRTIVLLDDSNEQYPQFISVDFTQDKCDVLNDYNIGDEVSVSINVGGREWINPEGVAKYFNSITGWRIEKVEAQDLPPTAQFTPQATTTSAEPDDLPF